MIILGWIITRATSTSRLSTQKRESMERQLNHSEGEAERFYRDVWSAAELQA